MKIAALPPVLAALLLLAAPAVTAQAAEPEVIASRPFDVHVERTGGATLVIDFALALSEIDTYPVTITAIAGSTEEQLYNGSLAGGVYRLRVAPSQIRSGPLKVVLRTRVVNRTSGGNQTYIVYQTWEGSL